MRTRVKESNCDVWDSVDESCLFRVDFDGAAWTDRNGERATLGCANRVDYVTVGIGKAVAEDTERSFVLG